MQKSGFTFSLCVCGFNVSLFLVQIPSMAVEMPGSSDISGLNLQFGALQFGSEPVLPEYESAPNAPSVTPGNQGQNSLYTSGSR